MVYSDRPMKTKSKILLFIIGSLSALIGGYSIYFTTVMSAKPDVKFANDSKFGRFVLDNCPVLNEAFSPTWWAGTSLMQTIFATMFRSHLDGLRYTRELTYCPDGGVVSLDWFEATPSSEVNGQPSPIAVMFPGLIGDSQSDYLRYIVPAVQKLGYRVASFNNRGRGGMDLRTPRLYSAANFEDVELVIDSIRERNPNSFIMASGFSMGGMVLTRYLAERGDKAKVDAAMLISSNYDLVNGTKNMETGYINKFVAKVMTKSLVDVLLQDKEMLSSGGAAIDWEKAKQATTFRELDRYFTCPMWNYSSPDEYFLDATNNNRMPKIRVPTLALNSADDIFSPYETLPLDRLNDAVVFVVTQRGGHLGFMDRWLPSVPYYGDRLIEQFHKAMLKVDTPKNLLTTSE